MALEVLACIGIGSNLGDREARIQSAIDAINNLPGCRIDKCSEVVETPAWGLTNQPHFLNAVCGIVTILPPKDLLSELQKIEHQNERIREQRWGPRTLDLDIICYGDVTISTAELTLPHPHFSERLFVLEPLAEIYPDLHINGKTSRRHLAELKMTQGNNAS